MSQLFSGKDSFEKFDAFFFTKKPLYHQAVKRRAVFILGAMW